jgi:hypothetical protein
MTDSLLYVVGSPGVGKSTFVAALTAGLPILEQRTQPFAHIVYPGAIQLGTARDGGFPGTDALSMSVISRVEPWLHTHPAPVLLGEGDRLATGRFFAACRAAGYALTLLYLSAPESIVSARRWFRGSRQNPSWVQGRTTKAARLAEQYGALVLDATQPVDALVAQVRALPAVRALLTGAAAPS